MVSDQLAFDRKAAVDRLMRFLAVEGITGKEEAIGKAVVAELLDAGVPRKAIRFDKANYKIPLPTQTGNLIVQLSGTRPGPRRLFMTHLDTVPLCAGSKPLRKGNRIVPAGKTALGGDNRTGVACLATMISTLLSKELPHPLLTIMFTVREESGLWGARFVDIEDLDSPSMGFNVDGRSPLEITIGAVGAERWQVEIHGRAAHAGVHPERGISATMVGAIGLARAHEQGWFGKIRRDGKEGTSNIGSFGGDNGTSAGAATNVVNDYALLKGEARSHDAKFVREITRAYKQAFADAAAQVRNEKQLQAKLKFTSRLDYYPFKLKEDSAVVRQAIAAAELAAISPTLRTTNGGLDANWLSRHGIPTITFGAGQNDVHTLDEWVNVDDFLAGCKYALALAQS